MNRTKIAELLQLPPEGQTVAVKGWVRTRRKGKGVRFVELNDGSGLASVQIVINTEQFSQAIIGALSTGAALSVQGTWSPSEGEGQKAEIQAQEMEVLGEADPNRYPLQKKAHSLEFLREQAHLRMRTNTYSAVFRVRHELAFAVHKFFYDRGFFYINTPIITAADAEGAGEMFNVTTLDPEELPRDKKGRIDYKQDFFGRKTHLTVSGQLSAEMAALGLSLVYTFGPTFRAEESHTSRHLSEFWMVEPEMAFYDLKEDMELAEEFLKYCIGRILENRYEDLEFLAETYHPERLQTLHQIKEQAFEKLSYSDAVRLLEASGQDFEYPPIWGQELQTEHERYLVEQHFGKPAVVYDYPKDAKAFYMRQNDDGQTVAAMDVLFPGIGEIIGGSQREERLEPLQNRMKALQMSEKALWWYLETRRFGTVPHSGFGLGFERFVQFCTGMGNIRDVIPFPRFPKNAEF